MEEDKDKTSLPRGPKYVPPHERGPGGSKFEQNRLALGLGIGVALGVAFGIALGNVGLGIGVGVAIGAGIGTSLGAAGKKKRESEDKREG